MLKHKSKANKRNFLKPPPNLLRKLSCRGWSSSTSNGSYTIDDKGCDEKVEKVSKNSNKNGQKGNGGFKEVHFEEVGGSTDDQTKKIVEKANADGDKEKKTKFRWVPFVKDFCWLTIFDQCLGCITFDTSKPFDTGDT